MIIITKLKQVYKKIKESFLCKILIRCIRIIQNIILDIKANHYIKVVGFKKNAKPKIKVGFIVQLPGVWDKEEPIYTEMKKSEEIETFLLVVPNVNQVTKEFDSYDNNYFVNRYSESIKIMEELKYKSFEEFNLDYVFYPRPYDFWLPKELQSNNVVKYAKCCYLPYGVKCEDNNIIGIDFLRNISIFFASTIYEQEWMLDYYKKYYKNGLRKCVYLGYPAMHECLDFVKENTKIERILWTPRWTYNQNVGGSHFIEYKDSIIGYAKNNNKIKWICRPHPLMFNNFIGTGIMSKEDVDDFKEKLDKYHITLDNAEQEIITVLKDIDVLITDFSSILGMFFAMKKPIIYCMSDDIKLNIFYKKLLTGMYVASSWEDIEKYLECLLNGNDYLKETRDKIWDEEFQTYISYNTSNIVDYIIDDYNNLGGKQK